MHISENIQTSLLLRFHVLKQGYKKEETPNIDILSRPEKHTNISVLQIPRAKTRVHLPPASSLRHVRHLAHVGLVDVYKAANFFKEKNLILGQLVWSILKQLLQDEQMKNNHLLGMWGSISLLLHTFKSSVAPSSSSQGFSGWFAFSSILWSEHLNRICQSTCLVADLLTYFILKVVWLRKGLEWYKWLGMVLKPS